MIRKDPSGYWTKMLGLKYADDQPRDDHGRWTAGGGGAVAEDRGGRIAAQIAKKPIYDKAKYDGASQKVRIAILNATVKEQPTLYKPKPNWGKQRYDAEKETQWKLMNKKVGAHEGMAKNMLKNINSGKYKDDPKRLEKRMRGVVWALEKARYYAAHRDKF
jgi:hypothetical protein